MTRNELLFKATIFRRAIEKAKSAEGFVPQRFKPEKMNTFPPMIVAMILQICSLTICIMNIGSTALGLTENNTITV